MWDPSGLKPRDGPHIKQLAARQETSEDANSTAQQENANGHQQKRLANDGRADITDKIKNLRSYESALRQQISHGIGCDF